MQKIDKKAGSVIKEKTDDMKAELQETGKELKAGVQKTGKSLKSGVEASVDKSRKAIQKRPLTAIGVAAGAGAAVAAGVIAGAVLTQKQKAGKKKNN